MDGDEVISEGAKRRQIKSFFKESRRQFELNRFALRTTPGLDRWLLLLFSRSSTCTASCTFSRKTQNFSASTPIHCPMRDGNYKSPIYSSEPFVGNQFNLGTSDFLSRHALRGHVGHELVVDQKSFERLYLFSRRMLAQFLY